jgi:hypothetical protein
MEVCTNGEICGENSFSKVQVLKLLNTGVATVEERRVNIPKVSVSLTFARPKI